jgi:hypothetical protein
MAYTRQNPLFQYSPTGTVIGTASLTFAFEQEGGNWVGVCLELGTSAYDADLEEASHQLADAVSLQLNEMERLGYITEYLEERNIRFQPLPTPDMQGQAFVVAGAGNR